MACKINRRQLLGATPATALGLMMGMSLLTRAATPALAAAVPAVSPATSAKPIMRLYMGVPEIVTGVQLSSHAPTMCPGRLVRDHGNWWVC
jgi:hypothetical protein